MYYVCYCIMFAFNKTFRIFQVHKFFLELHKLIYNCTICVELHVKINPVSIPTDIRSCSNIGTFKNKYRTFLTEQYLDLDHF